MHVLKPIRSLGAFHYLEQRFKENLEKRPEVAELVVAQFSGMCGYAVKDDFATRTLLEATGMGLKRYEKNIDYRCGLRVETYPGSHSCPPAPQSTPPFFVDTPNRER